MNRYLALAASLAWTVSLALPGLAAAASEQTAEHSTAAEHSVAEGQSAADPTMHQIYLATKQGRIDDAKEMIGRVLKDHPHSAKAHYVAAEVYVHTCDRDRARDELRQAEKLDPDLAFASERAVGELKAALRRPVPARCGVIT